MCAKLNSQLSPLQSQRPPYLFAASLPKSSWMRSQEQVRPLPNTSAHARDHHDPPFKCNLEYLPTPLPPFYLYCCHLGSGLCFLCPDTETSYLVCMLLIYLSFHPFFIYSSNKHIRSTNHAPGTEDTKMKRKLSLTLESSKFRGREKHLAEKIHKILITTFYVLSEHKVELLSFEKNQRVTCELKLQG